ncbi:putative holliday junction resolvase [Ferrimonas marina]|uniref:Putative pre-16S rRNA nuclease n=2 Tax=Ferrimonas marina TaxID=299255 RepID=A0A1M5YCQ5_9GAMM|nr:putative holliday junction resolvase [Ferrimonas marina]
MGFDFGTKSIGVAVGNSITGTAKPLVGIKAQDGIPNWDQVEKLIREWQPDKLVVGLPLNMDGTEQHVTRAARKFANRLFGRYGIETLTQDERLTTTDAKARLFEQGGYRALSKGAVDAQSAAVIVESYFESMYG